MIFVLHVCDMSDIAPIWHLCTCVAVHVYNADHLCCADTLLPCCCQVLVLSFLFLTFVLSCGVHVFVCASVCACAASPRRATRQFGTPAWLPSSLTTNQLQACFFSLSYLLWEENTWNALMEAQYVTHSWSFSKLISYKFEELKWWEQRQVGLILQSGVNFISCLIPLICACQDTVTFLFLSGTKSEFFSQNNNVASL